MSRRVEFDFMRRGTQIVPRHISFQSVEFASVTAAQHTTWTFADVLGGGGLSATVEVTCADVGQAVSSFSELVSRLKGKEVGAESDVAALSGLTTAQLQANQPLATAVSALRTAVVDLQSQHDGVSMTEALGGAPQHSVPLYANINRHLLAGPRSPAAFGEAAERAVRDGFAIVKCAPFDEVSPPAGERDILGIARQGIERVAAVRAAVGRDVAVLVDCHSRFETHTAPVVAEELQTLDVGWFEEPLEPTKDADGLAHVAATVGMPVAGGESGYGKELFAGLLTSGAVSVIMPDVKYCGGAAEACYAGRAAIEAGGRVSLHSPSGPVSQLASAHVTAAMPGAFALEHAAYEADWRADLLEPPERIEGGRLWLPGGVGLGARLNDKVVRQHGRRWRA